jgi:hypothetical protein
MTTTINGSSPSITFSDATTQTTAAFGTGSNLYTTGTNIGIGTSSPSQKLDVTGIVRVNEDGVGTKVMQLRSNYASLGPAIQVTTNDPLLFLTNNTEAVRVDSSQNVRIGTTSTIAGEKLSVYQSASTWAMFIQNNANNSCLGITNGSGTGTYTALAFYNNGTSFSACGTITISGSSTSYLTSSDYRLKENIAPMTGALAQLQALKPITYKWKTDGSDGQGFIAHELAEVCPQAVHGKKDAVDDEGNPIYQGIDTSKLVATLTAAIQELNAKVEAQALEIAALKAK